MLKTLANSTILGQKGAHSFLGFTLKETQEAVKKADRLQAELNKVKEAMADMKAA